MIGVLGREGGSCDPDNAASTPTDPALSQSYSTFSVSVLGKVLSAVGSAQLLMSQKFQQFRGLCEQNLVSALLLSPSLWRPPTSPQLHELL